MYITSPVSWPIAKVLDAWLGKPKAPRFSLAEMQQIVHLHDKADMDKLHGHLSEDILGLYPQQMYVIQQNLVPDPIQVQTACVEAKKVYSLPFDAVYTKELAL